MVIDVSLSIGTLLTIETIITKNTTTLTKCKGLELKRFRSTLYALSEPGNERVACLVSIASHELGSNPVPSVFPLNEWEWGSSSVQKKIALSEPHTTVNPLTFSFSIHVKGLTISIYTCATIGQIQIRVKAITTYRV